MGQELVALGWDGRELPLHSYIAYYYLDERALRRSLAFLRLGLAEPDTFNVLLADSAQHEAILRELRSCSTDDVELARGRGRPATLRLIEDFAKPAAPPP